MKCVFENGHDVCQRCQHTNKVCIVEGRKVGRGPNKRELMMRELASKDQLIDSLLRQVSSVPTSSPLIPNSNLPLPLAPSPPHPSTQLPHHQSQPGKTGNNEHEQTSNASPGPANLHVRLPPTVVNSSMSSAEIASALEKHGCLDRTEQLNLDTCSIFAVSNGGAGDVYSGRLRDDTRVAIKVFRLHLVHGQSGKHLKHAAKELHTWSKCQHPNVLPLLGLVEFRGQIGMVSPWIEQGDLRAYIERQPQVDRYQLCFQICDGLAYLHGIGIIHGDLKGANVLISDDGSPLLTDFGNSILGDQSLLFTKTVANSTMSPRWTAPEVLDGSASSSYAADVFSLGMTLLETITGNVPYHELERDIAVIAAISFRRVHPVRPELQLPTQNPRHDMFWELLTKCWQYEPNDRPKAAQARNMMRSILLSDNEPDEIAPNSVSRSEENTPVLRTIDLEKNTTGEPEEFLPAPEIPSSSFTVVDPSTIGHSMLGLIRTRAESRLDRGHDTPPPLPHSYTSADNPFETSHSSTLPIASAAGGKATVAGASGGVEVESHDMLAAMYALQDPTWWDTSLLPSFGVDFANDGNNPSATHVPALGYLFASTSTDDSWHTAQEGSPTGLVPSDSVPV